MACGWWLCRHSSVVRACVRASLGACADMCLVTADRTKGFLEEQPSTEGSCAKTAPRGCGALHGSPQAALVRGGCSAARPLSWDDLPRAWALQAFREALSTRHPPRWGALYVGSGLDSTMESCREPNGRRLEAGRSTLRRALEVRATWWLGVRVLAALRGLRVARLRRRLRLTMSRSRGGALLVVWSSMREDV